jgi:hypothetical protein
LKSLFSKTVGKTDPSPATPVAPAPVAPPVVAPVAPTIPTPVVTDATRVAEASGETFAQWLLRVHPEVRPQLDAYLMAATPFLVKGGSYDFAYSMIVSRPGPAAPRTDIPIPTSGNLLQPLTGYLLEVIHSIKDTDSYIAAVQEFRAAEYSEADIAGYINAYNPGGFYYGK